MSTLWDGLWASLVAAVVSAIVAVVVVHLSNRSARRSWYEQRRIEAYERVLTAFNDCWEITGRNWDYYEGSMQSTTADLAPILKLRDRDLREAENRASRAIDAWGLYLGGAGTDLLGAARRALTTLSGEWLWSSYLDRGGLYIPLMDLCPPDEGVQPTLLQDAGDASRRAGSNFVEGADMTEAFERYGVSPYEQEWDRFKQLAESWHRDQRARRSVDSRLCAVFRMRYHTVEDVVNSGAELRFSIE